MKTIQARRILDFSPPDIATRLKSSVILVYEDGVEIRHTAHELAVNRYVYSLLEIVPLKLVSKYSVHNYYVGGQYVANTINKAFEAILEDVVDKHIGISGDRLILEGLYERMYLIMEDIYNNIVYEHLEYVSSLNIRDFLDIQLKPELMSAIDEVRVKKDLDSVKNTYDVLDKVIRTSEDLRDNPIAKGYISGGISSNQVKQLLASRGFVTEIDSSIFKYPIASSFVLGMDDMYDMAVESRSGAKALYLSNRAISLAEYFAREMQLTTMAVERLVDGDCGNTEFIEWTVTESDYKNLLGKTYYLDGASYVINKSTTHLIGETIKIRNAMRCKLTNKRHVCTACFGRLSNNIPLHANLGHITLTVMSAIISQLILSTKHVTTSASSDTITLTPAMKEYFVVRNKDTYAFRANTISRKKQTFKLCIPQDQGYGIANIDKASDVYKLNIARVSKLSTIHLAVTNSDGSYTEIPLDLKQGTRYGNLTYDFLAYVRDSGYSLDSSDRFVIDLDGWSSGVALVSLPQVEFSYIDLAKAIKEEFKSMKTVVGTPEAFLHKIFTLVNSKLDVNLAMLEMIVYAFTVEDPTAGKFGMSRGSDNAAPTKMMNIMTNRSVGGSYAWEYVMSTLLSPRSYYGNNNVNHILDVMLKPNEALLERYGKL